MPPSGQSHSTKLFVEILKAYLAGSLATRVRHASCVGNTPRERGG